MIVDLMFLERGGREGEYCAGFGIFGERVRERKGKEWKDSDEIQ